MNLKMAKAIRRYAKAVGKDWREATYTIDRHGTVRLGECGKGFYRYFKRY